MFTPIPEGTPQLKAEGIGIGEPKEVNKGNKQRTGSQAKRRAKYALMS
jgi:hypothetical protein